MMYGSWDTECNRQNFLSFWTIFCSFTPLTTRKIKILKNWSVIHLETPIHTSVPKIMIICYAVWDMVHDRCNYFSFWVIFCPFNPLTAQKLKIFKKWKKCLEISSFYICVPKIMIRWYSVPEIWCITDGWTDGWTEKETYRGGCPT